MSQSFEEWVSFKKSNLNERHFVNKIEVENFLTALWNIFFLGYGEEVKEVTTYFEAKVLSLTNNLRLLLKGIEDVLPQKPEAIVKQFKSLLPKIDQLLRMDIEAIFDGDPAAGSKEEIILCYPGLYAIFVYRIAHELALLDVPILPRVFSEYAHSKTGIDIHPKATIGHHFFIDHGTGIVIGETTEIGNYVKLYHGVTLGALSLKQGHLLKGTKRHPTILDHVTIYSNASIFGGDTIIGPNVRIGSYAFITKSTRENRENI